MAAVLIAASALAAPASAPAFADDGSADASAQGRTLRVAFPEVEGISEIGDDGVRSGIFYDWLTEISKYTGWRYEFVDGDAEDLMERTKAGDIDLIGGMYYREQIADQYEYSAFAIGSNHALLISLEENDDVVTFDPRTLNGKTIGTYRNAAEKIRRLEHYLEFNGIECTVLQLDYDAYA